MKTSTDYRHIQLDDRGQAIIQGTTMKVSELIMSRIAYYWDNKTAIDTAIFTDFESTEEMRIRAGETPFVSRLKALGLK